MKGLSTIVVVALFQTISTINGRSTSSHKTTRSVSIVDVEVRRLSLRSTTDSHSYTVNVNEKDGHQYKLALESPKSSIFSENFKFNVAHNEGENGNSKTIFRDDTPTAEELRSIENQIYVDSTTNAVLKVTRNSHDENFKIHGIIDNFALYPTTSSNKEVYEMVQVRSTSTGQNDYIDLHRNITQPPQALPYSRGPTKIKAKAAAVNAQPEIWVVFDYDNSQLFGQNRNRVLDYLGVFFHAINNRYATFSDPSISFRIAGVTITSSRSAQPYMESNKIPDGSGYDINNVLDAFSKWVYTNQKSGPKFDMTALIAGIDFKSKEGSTYTSGVAGLAYLKAACYKTSDRWFATSVTEDRGGYFDGMFSVAHEFAHNLGAPHDGDDDASSCSWDNGYIMSYKGWGTTNKFYFSSCSIKLMKNYISSNEGSCLRSIQSSTNIPISSQDVGDRYNMTALCVKYTSQAKAVPEPTKSADELCRNLSCRYPTPNKPEGYYSIVTLNHPPGDNTPCGTSGGKCVNGACVAKSIG